MVKNQTVTVNFDFSTRNYKIGRWQDSGNVHQFNGKIHNVILYNRTLSDAEVQKLYAALPTSYKSNESTYNQEPTSGRILYVDGAEPSSYYLTGLSFNDLSGFNRNGSLLRATRLQGLTTKTGTYPEFKTFNAGYFYFNGFLTNISTNPDQKGNSYISFPSPTTFLPSDSNPSTIIAWARAKPSPSSIEYRYIFSYGTYNPNGQNRYVGIKYPDQFSIGGAGVANGSTILNQPGMVPDEWFQIAFVYINAEMRLFVNGRLLNIKPSTLNTTTPFRSAHIGRSNTDILTDTSTTDGYFYGDIAQVLVYNRALTEQEIYQHYKVTRDRFGAPIVERPTSVSAITLPIVTTVPPSEITTTSAKSGVIINFNGNSTITASGILIRLKTQTGTFEFGVPGVTNISGTNPINITSLSPSTNYEIRAYAYNGEFYGYGQSIDLTTSSPSVLTVLAVTASFTGNYATASGQVTDLGGNIGGYGTRGFVWSTSTINVSTANNIVTDRIEESLPGTPFWTDLNEQWKLRVEPLLQGTTYYLRAYARINNGSNVYSDNELVFTTYTFATIDVIIPTATDDILSITAKITGNLLTTGGTTVTQRGIVWSTNPNPTISDSRTNNGPGGIGLFVGELNGLSAGTLYYVRAYAINIAGVAYSSTRSFTTDTSPAVTTVDMAYNNLYRLAFVGPTIKQSATASGSITNINGDPITEVGVVWSTLNTNIDIDTNQGKVSLTTGITNNFNVKIPDLTINTLYYYRAYAVNSAGVGYGTIKQFKTLGTSTPTGLPTVTRVSTPSELNSTPGSVTLRAFVDKTAFGNSDFYGEPLTVGFLYTVGSNPFTRVVVSTNYLLSDAQLNPPANYFTTNLTLPTGFSYIIRAFSQFKGYPFDVVGESTTSWNLGVYNFPTLTTKTATSISFSGAQSGGVISNNGGDTVISRGVVWTTDEFADPIYPDDSNNNISGSGVDYNAAITGLIEGTIYYYRAFARNSAGVGYGNKRSLTTTSRVGVATNAGSALTANSATLNGTTAVELGGYVDIDEVGFYWSTSETSLPLQPAVGTTVTTTATKVPAGADVQPGNFSSTITSLSPGVTYYFVAYTTNPAGTNIGNVRNFTTTSITRATVTIGSQGIITNTSIQITGSIVSTTGGGNVTRGVVWSTNPLPILSTNNFTSDGSGLGSFNSSITGLLSGTIYYVRAYVTNEAGTNYSTTQLSVTTYLITTGDVANSFSNKLDVIGSSITWTTPSITARGVVWSTSPSPTIADSKTTDGSGPGTFNSPNVQILLGSTTYYIRAYATTGGITYYGNQITFTTPAHPTVLGFKLSTALYRDPTKPLQFHNISFPPAFNSYQEFMFSINVGLSNIWTPGFVYSTTVNTLSGLVRGGGVGISEFIDTSNARINNTNGTTDFYSGINVDYNFRPYYIRGFLTDGVNTIYSVVVGPDPGFRQINMPILTPTYIIGNVPTNGTIPITLTVGSMRPGQTPPVINNIGVIVHPSDSSGVITSGQSYTNPNWYFSGSLPLNASNQCIITVDIRSITPPLGHYSLLGYVEYTSLYDGTIRIYTARSTAQRQAIVLAAISTGTSTFTSNSATITGSNLTTNGGGNVTAGVCWGTSINPTITGSKTTDITNIGLFNSNIFGLSSGTLYYVRAYATNEAGTSYGSQISFTTTGSGAIQLSTQAVTLIGRFTATFNGTVTSDGGSSLVVRGFVYGTTPNPTTTDPLVTTAIGIGQYSIPVNGQFDETLLPGTTYYVRAYAANINGPAYGNQVQFTTLP